LFPLAIEIAGPTPSRVGIIQNPRAAAQKSRRKFELAGGNILMLQDLEARLRKSAARCS
jgi:hypothetical protein